MGVKRQCEALADLLPSLRSERIKSLPPRDRLSYVAKELTLWREAERTSSRGGGDGGRVPSSVGTDDAKEHVGVGYPAAYQVQLRRLLASEAYQDAETIVKNYMDSGEYAEAISSIFATGMFPLVHALIGKRRSLPGYPLVDRIAEQLRPLRPGPSICN